MDRGSDKHGARQDDYLKKELRGLEQADHSTRAQEWRDPEPPADDDPQLTDPRGAGELELTTVADVMTPDVISVSAAAPVTDAAELMRENDIGSLFVIDADRAVGVITDRDLAVRVMGAGLSPATTAVGDVCSKEVASVSAESDVHIAVDIMRRRRIRRLLVVGADDRPQGVISLSDVAVSQQPESVLADITLAEPPRINEDA